MSSIDKINVGGVDFDITSSPTPVMAPVETGTTATKVYVVGDYVIVGSTLHEVTAAIAIGDTFTEGTNISTSTSLGDEIKQINNDLTSKQNKVTSHSDSGRKVVQSGGYIILDLTLDDIVTSSSMTYDSGDIITNVQFVGSKCRLYGRWADSGGYITNISGRNVSYTITYLSF